MAQQTVLKRSAAAPGANTDTTIFTPAAGVKYKLLFFYVVNEVAAQAAGMLFELRYGGNALAAVGFDSATAPIGQMSKEAVLSHEFVGDGSTAVIVRNLTALAATSVGVYTVGYDANY
jgi:hypothetical protein